MKWSMLAIVGLLILPPLAQVSPDVSIPDGLNLLGTGITGGILTWYLWFNVARIQPRKEAEFIRQLDSQEKDHISAMEKQSGIIQDILARHRDERAKWDVSLKEVVAVFKSEMNEQRTHCTKEVASAHALWERWTAQKFGAAATRDPTKPSGDGGSGIHA